MHAVFGCDDDVGVALQPNVVLDSCRLKPWPTCESLRSCAPLIAPALQIPPAPATPKKVNVNLLLYSASLALCVTMAEVLRSKAKINRRWITLNRSVLFRFKAITTNWAPPGGLVASIICQLSIAYGVTSNLKEPRACFWGKTKCSFAPGWILTRF